MSETEKSQSDKILKDEEEDKKNRKKLMHWIIGLEVIVALCYTIKPVQRKLGEFASYIISKFHLVNLLQFLDKIKIHFESLNILSTGMGIFSLIVVGVLIYTFVTALNNPYKVGNQTIAVIFGLLALISSVFFFIRIKNKGEFFAGADSPMPQLRNIWNIILTHKNTYLPLCVTLLAIIIIALLSFNSEKSFVMTGTASMMILGVVAMFAAYTFIVNSKIFEKIKQFQPLLLLFNLIFIIPCLVAMFFNWTTEQMKITPSFVYVILLIELIIIAMYLFIPFASRIFYFSLTNNKSNADDLNKILKINKQNVEDMEKKIFKIKKDFFRQSHGQYKYMNEQGVNDTWDELANLYNANKSGDLVMNRLRELGFCEKVNGIDASDCMKQLPIFVEYIKDKNQIIIGLNQQITKLKKTFDNEEGLLYKKPVKKDKDGNETDLSGVMVNIKDSIVLQMNPVSLKKNTTPKKIDETINLFKNVAGQTNYSYGLSFWIFIHPQSGNVKQCNNIIDFDGRPKIMYCPVYRKIPEGTVVEYTHTDGKTKRTIVVKSVYKSNGDIKYDLQDVEKFQNEAGVMVRRTYKNANMINIKYDYPYSVLKFVLGSDKDTRQEYTMPNLKMQKWNNIVVNYIDGTYDLFVNGILVNSFQGGMEKFTYNDISIGQDNGISGGIANVLYYKNYLTKDKILSNYNLLKRKSPPIIDSLIKM